MPIKKTLLLFSCCLLFIHLRSQSFTNVLINSNEYPEEMSIAISPNDTNIMVAGANIDLSFRSTDGGRIWTKQHVYSPLGVFGDPCIIADTSGDFYYFHLSDNTNIHIWPKWCDRIVCQKSTDNGATWNNSTYMGLDSPRMQDKAWAALNPVNNEIAICWTSFDVYGSNFWRDSSKIRFSLSGDRGATWSPAKTINELYGNCSDDDSTAEGAVPAFGSNGEIYVAWALDGKIYFDRSTDNGSTWLDSDKIISTQPGGWAYPIPQLNRCNGLPVTVTDLSSSPYRGTIYVNWTDQRNGLNDADVFMVKSMDGGDTWSAPLRVNDDAPGKQNFMSWLTVDQNNGDVYVVFYDRRNYSSDSTDVYMARSTDGGNAFVNFKISETPFLPVDTMFFGDYINVSAVNGCVRPCWMRMDDGNSSAWTALVNFNHPATEIAEINANRIFRLLNQNPTSGICVVVSEVENYSIEIYDMMGRLINKTGVTNTRYFKFSLHDYISASGVYFLKCTRGEYQEVLKVVFSN